MHYDESEFERGDWSKRGRYMEEGHGITPQIAQELITVIVLEDGGVKYGVNGWVANEKDRRLYIEGGQYEHED